jgi:membrane protein DedA with SNARE-associated domain
VQGLFERHGGAIVLAGRFVAVLRAYASLVAGSVGMRWARFLAFHAIGAIAWACLFGLGAYALGAEFERVARPAGIGLLVASVVAIGASVVVMKRRESALTR